MNVGIDYGMGETNIDRETHIRYGVIPQNDVLQAWADSSEAEYPCEMCECEQGDDTCSNSDCGSGFYLDDGEYKASQSQDDTDIFILKSPYYTHAQFCSPCAPGAGHLGTPCEDGPKTYCFGHDWFEDNKAPYPVFRVDNDEEVLAESVK